MCIAWAFYGACLLFFFFSKSRISCSLKEFPIQPPPLFWELRDGGVGEKRRGGKGKAGGKGKQNEMRIPVSYSNAAAAAAAADE